VIDVHYSRHMPPVATRMAPTVVEFVRIVGELAAAADERPLWFRGCGKATFRLVPSIYRYRDDLTPHELVALENEMVTMFRQRSGPFYPSAGATLWDYLFLMQHFGAPTRLIDWSENGLIALYFALLDAQRHQENDIYSVSAVVWVLDPALWNEHAMRDSGGERKILSTEDVIAGYEPHSRLPMRPNSLALYGAHTNPRIVAQRGTFTIFGLSKTPMEEEFEDEHYPAESLTKIEVPAGSIGQVRSAIDALGMTESMIYPDLEGLARELTRRYGLRR
jgi:hypothetical protein